MKFLILIFVFINILFADSSTLTRSEKKWIQNHEVKVGVTDLYPLTYINKDNQMDGFANDILKLIIKKYNIKTKIVVANQGTIFSSFKTNQIDLVSLVNDAKVESSFGLYSSPILQIKKILFVKKEQHNINSFDDLKYKKIAIINVQGSISKIKKRDPSIKIVQTKNMQESVQSLLEGNVDALMASPIIIQTYLEDNLIIGLKAMPLISFEPSNLYFFTNKNKPELHSILQKGLNSISIKEEKELFDKWFLRDLANLPLKLTHKELSYLRKKISVNMCADPDWMPYEKIVNHKHIGIVADYMKKFEEKIGIPIKLIETKNWTQSLEYMKNRNCDILSLAMVTKDRQKYMSFTKEYITAPLVLVTKKNTTFITDLQTLKHKKIGIQRDFAYNEKIRRLYPEMNVVDVDHLHTGLQKVERGELFGQVTTHLNVAYAFQKEFFGSLQISGKFDESWKLSVGVRNDDLVLFNIFEKVINSITDETRQKIINNWVSIKYEEGFDYELFWKILAFFIFILLLITYTYIMQRKYISKLTKVKEEIEMLNSTLERKVELRTRELEYSNKKLKIKTSELEDLNNNLDVRIKEEINNRKKQEQLLIQQSKLAEMGEMISMIAHQWRQPLSALSTLIQNIHLSHSLGKLDKQYLDKQMTLSN
ncbi:MAG: transporter substrate-binding domain-containing protein, partial [Campylobacteraceae bacterium]|nr:transporter substrate-binding domain-containing protein [Campylobacteraceae bacterium]